MRCATRWPTVSTALQRPNESTVGTLRLMYSEENGPLPVSYTMTLANEKVRWRRSSQDGWGPRKTLS